jgi:hypothetical protein
MESSLPVREFNTVKLIENLKSVLVRNAILIQSKIKLMRSPLQSSVRIHLPSHSHMHRLGKDVPRKK